MDKFKKLLDYFIEGKIKFKKFEKDFLDFYLNTDDYELLNEKQKSFLDEINEKIDYTNENPNSEDRKYGFVDVDEFRGWLKEYKKENIQFLDNIGS